jgi:hypothetical protein
MNSFQAEVSSEQCFVTWGNSKNCTVIANASPNGAAGRGHAADT